MTDMRRYLLACLAAGALLASCAVEPLREETVDTPDGELPVSTFEQGHIRVYLDEEMTRLIEENEESMELTKAGQTLPGFRMERTFPYAGEFEARTREAGLHRWYDVYFDEKMPITKAGGTIEDIFAGCQIEYRPLTRRAYDQTVIVVPAPAEPEENDAIFNDPMLERQWHYYNDGHTGGMTAGCDVNVMPVWMDGVTGDQSVIVAVVDGGVDYQHEDLAANMWQDPSRTNESHGYNFKDRSYSIHPEDHGTHVAGTIAAVNNNGTGVCGLAGGDAAKGVRGVQIMTCQIFDDSSARQTSGNGAAAIKWAADHGAVIAQNSWGYININYVPASDIAAIDYFNDFAGLDKNGNQVGPMAGGIVIFSAGNDNDDFGSPAAYEGALSVASVGADYIRAYYSNFGDWVDIMAPGGDAKKGYQIMSTLTSNRYGLMQGTSMACPHVSGVAALVVSKCGGPGFTRNHLWNRLVNLVQDVSAYNRGYALGSGLVDAEGATSSTSSVPPAPVTDLQVSLVNSNFLRFSLTVTANPDGAKANGFNIYFDTEPFTDTRGISYKTYKTGSLKAGDVLEDIISRLEFETTYYFACTAFDRIGNSSALSNLVSVTTGPNHAPQITTTDNLTFTLKAHERTQLTFVYSDEDGHSVHSEIIPGSKADTLMPMDKNSFVQKVDVIGRNAPAGTYTSILEALDEYDLGTQISYTYTILPNHGPVVIKDIDDMLFSGKNQLHEVDLRQIFNDQDGETLTYKTECSDNDVLNLHEREGILYITTLRYGSCDCSVTAKDALGETATTSFRAMTRDDSRPLDIYPTQVRDGKLYIRTTSEEQVHVQIAGTTGSTVLDITGGATPFEPLTVDISALSAGPYSVAVYYDNKVELQNIVKL